MTASITHEDQATRLRAMIEQQAAPAPARQPSVPAPRLDRRLPTFNLADADAAPRAPMLGAQRVRSARVIAVASGKGGVGKTNICVNLASAFADLGCRTVLLDGDLGLANADVLCGINARGHLGHVIDGARTIEEITIDAPGGFRLVPGAGGLARLADIDDRRRTQLIEGLATLDADADVVIVDCGAGVGANVIAFTLAADCTLAVTTPEPTAMADAYGLLKSVAMAFRHRGAVLAPEQRQIIAMCINQARDRAEAASVLKRMQGVADRFLGVRIIDAGWIPEDPAIPDAVRRRTPLLVCHPKRPASQRLRLVARDLRNLLELTTSEDLDRPGLASRLLHRLIRL
ncbi:MAG: MinD/ParA family protein [Phycisphaeraceae bacterium]|nr:MinD/ParA family protein [Phycisphaeraceae bacterium]